MILGIELAFFVLMFLIVTLISTLKGRQRKKQTSRDLDDWARALGMVRVGDELCGAIDEVPVVARLAFDSPHGTKLQATWTLYARIQPPLDLGLLAHHTNRPVELPGAGIHYAYGYSPEFSRRFQVRCDEPERAVAVMSTAVQNLMVRRLHPRAMCMVSDGGVAVQTPQSRATVDALRNGLHTVAAIANEMNAARSRAPAASTLRDHQASWRRFGAHNGLTIIHAPLCMFGQFEDATVYAYSGRTSPGHFYLEVWMRFEIPLALGLLVQPMRTVDRMKDLFGAVDHKLGEPLFDETFLVRVSDAEGVTQLLDEETRKRLLILHDTVGPLSLTDDGVSVRLPYVPRDPAVVPTIVKQLFAIARFISEKRQRDRQVGPYR